MIVLTPPFGIAQAPPLTGCSANARTGTIFAEAEKTVAGDFSGFALVGSQFSFPGSMTMVTADSLVDVAWFANATTTFPGGYANASVTVRIDLMSLDDDLHASQEFTLFNAHAAFVSTEHDHRTTTMPLGCMIRRAATTGMGQWQAQVSVQAFGFAAGVAAAQAFAKTTVSSIVVK